MADLSSVRDQLKARLESLQSKNAGLRSMIGEEEIQINIVSGSLFFSFMFFS